MKLYTAALLAAAAIGGTIGYKLPTVPAYMGESCTVKLARHGYYPDTPGISRTYLSSVDSEYWVILDTCDTGSMTEKQFSDAWHHYHDTQLEN